MEYSLVLSLEIDRLVAVVNHCLKEGWRPQGSICVDDGYGFYQAIVRDVPPGEDRPIQIFVAEDDGDAPAAKLLHLKPPKD